MALAAAVRIVDRTLQVYEQEAELVSAANGWSINRVAMWAFFFVDKIIPPFHTYIQTHNIYTSCIMSLQIIVIL